MAGHSTAHYWAASCSSVLSCGVSEEGAEALGCVLLEVVRDVHVAVLPSGPRWFQAGVPQTLAHNGDVHVSLQEQGGVRVAEVVEPDALQAGWACQPLELAA